MRIRKLNDCIYRFETNDIAERHAIYSLADTVAGNHDYAPLSMSAGHYADAHGRLWWYADVPPADGTCLFWRRYEEEMMRDPHDRCDSDGFGSEYVDVYELDPPDDE